MANGIDVKVVFVQKRNKKSKWLAILSTDCHFPNKKLLESTEWVGILRSSLRRQNLYYESVLSPYIMEHIKRFGDYVIDLEEPP